VRRLHRLPAAPSWPPAAVTLDLPVDCPPDVRELARVATAQAAELLAGLAPTEAGLLVLDPRSPLCPDDLAAQGAIVCRVESLAWLRQLAAQLPLLAPLRPQPGAYVALLVGVDRCAVLSLSTRADGASEAS
jgi:hypothetical protein